MNYVTLMHKIVKKLRHTATHPITTIILLDIFLLMLIAAGMYVIAQILLPGSGSQFLMPHTFFLSLFTLYVAIIITTQHTRHTFIVTPPHTAVRAIALVIFIGLISIAHYFYGWIAGGILTGMCTLCYYVLMRFYDDILLQ